MAKASRIIARRGNVLAIDFRKPDPTTPKTPAGALRPTREGDHPSTIDTTDSLFRVIVPNYKRAA